MKKFNFKVLALGTLTAALVGISLTSLGGNSGNNRWNDRMVKPDDPSQDTKSTVNLRTGTVTNQNGATGGTSSAATGDALKYGAGTLHCRDSVLKINTQFDNPNSTGLSEIKVPELQHNEARVFNCVDITPALISSAGMRVNGGTVTIKCGNGQLHVAASTCTAPTPTPVPSVTPDPNATPSSTPPTTTSTPAPTPPPPAGYSVRACSSWCSDVNSSCRRRAGKGEITTTIYKSCQSGQVYFPNSGTCGAAPTNCL